MAAFFKRQMSIISRLLLPLLVSCREHLDVCLQGAVNLTVSMCALQVLSCATALPEPDSTQRPPLDVGLVQQLHGL
jgi:hypothetical protein